jgi:hypothetical protein
MQRREFVHDIDGEVCTLQCHGEIADSGRGISVSSAGDGIISVEHGGHGVWKRKNKTGFGAQHSVDLAEETRNVCVQVNVVNAHSKIDGCIHEKTEVGQFSFMELHHHI